MKFSESWLRTLVNPDVSGAEFSLLLTMAGLEVEEEETVAPHFDAVVVGHVLEVQKHPDADRLNVCRVDVGRAEPLQIVCGAPNVAPGLRVPCALPGAALPGDFRIKVAKVRGVESSGMLCSAKELGISDDASGLLVLPSDAPVGQDLRTYLDLDDRLRTLKLTPNRADCLSLTGIAREVAALTGATTDSPERLAVPASIPHQRGVILAAPDACPLYCGRVITGIDARAATPDWMRRRIERSGIRAISALVDITNYVMLETGQPLHAFDNAKLVGNIQVRMALPGEKLRLLNEQTLELQDDILLIADDEHAVAMAGIMGGEDSGISLETNELFLESAFFTPKSVAGRARRFGFASDASHRFERGVDFGATQQALERATALILEICGGQAGPISEAITSLPTRPPVRLRCARVSKVLGLAFTQDEIASLLSRLNFAYKVEGDSFVVTPPSYRFDIEIEEDLIEEIARLHGYDNIPNRAPTGQLSMLPETETARTTRQVRQRLVERGFQEVINFAFVDESWERDFAATTQPIKLANPISLQMGVMRSTLIGALVANLATNLKRKQNRVRLFETGRCFARNRNGQPVEGFDQPWRIAGLAYGGSQPEQWGNTRDQVDFFDIKGDVEALLSPLGARFDKATHPALHPGRCASIHIGEKIVGFLGELHPQWIEKYDLPQPAMLFELDLDILKLAHTPSFKDISHQPTATRDLAVLIDQNIAVDAVVGGLKANAPAVVTDIRLFDIYTGKGVPAGKKSLAFRIVMQDTQRTLQEAEVDAATNLLVAYMEQAFAAQLRV